MSLLLRRPWRVYVLCPNCLRFTAKASRRGNSAYCADCDKWTIVGSGT